MAVWVQVPSTENMFYRYYVCILCIPQVHFRYCIKYISHNRISTKRGEMKKMLMREEKKTRSGISSKSDCVLVLQLIQVKGLDKSSGKNRNASKSYADNEGDLQAIAVGNKNSLEILPRENLV